MVWLGDKEYRLAGALRTLWDQLVKAYPDTRWQNNPGTGTIGDAAHRAEGSASDHNPWLNNTVRAIDIAVAPGGPDCEALFAMVNRMYAARDPRVFPFGYAIFRGRITAWDRPGQFHAQQGDPHNTHLHISVGQTGYDATNPWPLPTTKEDDVSQADVITALQSAAGKAAVQAAVAGTLIHNPITNTDVPLAAFVQSINSGVYDLRQTRITKADIAAAVTAAAPPGVDADKVTSAILAQLANRLGGAA